MCRCLLNCVVWLGPSLKATFWRHRHSGHTVLLCPAFGIEVATEPNSPLRKTLLELHCEF